ncbi:MAG: hypothetical protein GF418_07020 [Chitinivibrionales bacterium]|nr:hypothetical protein [Chitinivibrionales bacterium]MBD3395362.1 hypothetical protein [Chitinivibrionales bacterium]
MRIPAIRITRLVTAVTAAALIAPGLARADNPLFTARGVGARALALGNSFTALANDYTAVYWNPAGIAFTPIREVRIGLEAMRSQAETEFGTTTSDASSQRLLITHAGLLRSIPTSQGGFAFAVGFCSPYRLDNVFRYQGWDTYTGAGREGYYTIGTDAQGQPIRDVIESGQQVYFAEADARGHGSLSLINLAVGWQIAPSLGLGVTLSPILGREYVSYVFETYKQENGSTYLFQDHIEEIRRRYRGVDARMGLLYAPSGIVRAGIRLVAPQYIRMYQAYTFREQYYGTLYEELDDEATITTSVSGAAGVAIELPFMTVSTESDFRSPFPDARRNAPQAYWRVGLSGGVEAPIPQTPLVVRAGYAWHEPDFVPYQIEWDNALEESNVTVDYTSDVHQVTGGVGAVLQNYLSLQASYAYSFWGSSAGSPDWRNAIDERHALHRMLVSFSFRY